MQFTYFDGIGLTNKLQNMCIELLLGVTASGKKQQTIASSQIATWREKYIYSYLVTF